MNESYKKDGTTLHLVNINGQICCFDTSTLFLRQINIGGLSRKTPRALQFRGASSLTQWRSYTEDRNGLKEWQRASGNMRLLSELIDFLYSTDELNRTYYWLTDSCQQFASRIYNYINYNA